VIAALQMYDFPGLYAANDALWSAIARRLTDLGVRGVPERLTRELDPRAVWSHPSLLLAQACEYPISRSFADSLTIVATPRYSARGCEDARYRSAIVIRASDEARSLDDLRARRCVINEVDSNSGVNLFRSAVAPLANGEAFFSSVTVTGSHRRNVENIVAGDADVAAIDCVTLAHLHRLEPALTREVRILDWTPFSPSLPFVTSRHTDRFTVEALRTALSEVIDDPALVTVRAQLLLEGFDFAPDEDLLRVRALEREAVALRYPTLC
jgi:ABC-type phosphate/phosphonate transport system substrate-binding protein